MKGSTIAIAAVVVFDLGLVGLRCAADRHARKASEFKAVETRSGEITENIREAEARYDIFKKVTAREKKDLERQVKDWKIANEFDTRKQDILDGVQENLGEFKDQIGYSEKLEAINDEFEASVEAFKNSIDYANSKRKLENTVKEAKAHYESQKLAFDLAGDDISETAMKLRHAAEESMNAKVKEAKVGIEALDQQLKEETEKLTAKKLNDIRELEEKVSKEKIRLDKKSDKELEKLNEELLKAQDDIQKKIRKSRSDEEKAAIHGHEDDVRLIREQKEADALAAEEIFDKMPTDIRFAEYLKEKKVPKAVVVMVGMLPCIPVGYLMGKYLIFVKNVVKAM